MKLERFNFVRRTLTLESVHLLHASENESVNYAKLKYDNFLEVSFSDVFYELSTFCSKDIVLLNDNFVGEDTSCVHRILRMTEKPKIDEQKL